MHLPQGAINSQLSQVFSFVALIIGAIAVKQSFSELTEKIKVALPAALTTAGQFFSSSRPLPFFRLKKESRNKISILLIILPLILLGQAHDLLAINGQAGHFLGASLAAIILGPYLGLLSISSVLLIQALAFGDGGLAVIGVNIFNMAVVGCLSAYFFYNLFVKYNFKKTLAIYFATLISVSLSALAYSLILFFSRKIDFTGLASIMTVHLIIGLLEGLVTVALIKFLKLIFGNLYVPDQAAENQKS